MQAGSKVPMNKEAELDAALKDLTIAAVRALTDLLNGTAALTIVHEPEGSVVKITRVAVSQ